MKPLREELKLYQKSGIQLFMDGEPITPKMNRAGSRELILTGSVKLPVRNTDTDKHRSADPAEIHKSRQGDLPEKKVSSVYLTIWENPPAKVKKL